MTLLTFQSSQPTNTRKTRLTMDTSQAIQPPQVLGQSPFFYYNPESSSDHRQHGHFSSYPNSTYHSAHLQGFQQPVYHPDMTMQPQRHGMHSRPTTSDSQVYVQSANAFPLHTNAMSMASPRPTYLKSPFTYQHDGQPLSLNTERPMADLYMYPSTPPLSVSGSALNSPPSSCGILQTPLSSTFFGIENIEGVKEGCEGDVQSEILAGGDWNRCGSPPLTPGMS